MRHLLLGFFPLIVAACTVSANVGDLDAIPSEDGTDAASPDAPVAPGAPVTDAGPDSGRSSPPSFEAGCGVTFVQQGTFFDVEVVHGVSPFLSGGAIVPGTYALVAMRVYDPEATGTMQIAETLRVRGSSSAGTLELLTESRSASGTFRAHPLRGERSTFEAAHASDVGDPSIFLTPECPTRDFGQFHRFGTNGDELTFFSEEAMIERVYRRIP